MVGDALQEGQSFHFDRRRLSNQLRCLGIAPWGYVLNREELISDNFNLPVPYKVSTVIATGRPVSLNQNHTHYIFVDEGRRMRYGGSESAKFRARLCKKIAQPWKSGGWSIPVVLVVVEGGHDVFIDARDCIRENVPVVICSGTGRAADILSMASVYRLKHQEKEFKDFHAEEKLMLRRKLVPVSGAKKVKEAIEMIVEIVHDPKLITTFDMNKSDDLDLAILYSLIKTNSCLTTQLKLAFTWDRSDIAEEKIFQQGARVDPESLEPTMMDALLQDKPEFVRILLQNGVAMRQFLTLERIHRLYNESKNREGLKKFLIHKGLLESQQTIRAISAINPIEKENPDLVSNNNNNTIIEQQAVDTSENYSSSVYLSTISRLAKKTIGRFSHHVYELDTPELFLWAVLHQRQSMAMFFWEHSEDALTLSLIACVLYKEMVKALPNYDSETADLYGGYIDAFENLAIKVLDECNSVDPDTTLYLIESETPLWGGYNCLNLADKATRRKFISSVACQNSLNFAWSHGIQASTGSLLLTLFCPIILLSKTFLKFQDKRTSFAVERQSSIEEDEDMKATSYDPDFVNTEEQVATPSTLRQHDSSRLSNFTNSSYPTRIPLKKKLVIFYTAPKVKFFLQTICVVPGSGKQKLKLWVKTYAWVYIDVIVVFLAIISMLLRIGLIITFTWAKSFYAVTLIICYIRIFRLYGFHPALGPKLVMIQRMLTELLIFIFIMVVILVSYGVAVQALLYPNQTEFDWNTVRDALYYPYWNLYGELNLEYSFAINSSCTGVPDGVMCPTYNFVAPLLLAFYLLLAGILLINLVIAMFSNVFQQVEYNSILLWKFSMYALVVEYNKRPVMPVPLSALQAIVELFQYVITRCKRERMRRHGSRSVSKTTTQVHVFVNCGSADESQPTQQTSKPRNAELKSTLNYEPYEDVQNDDGTELFGFLSMKTRRASAARDLLSGNSAILGNLDLLRKFASATAITEADEEMRIARLFETNCMHNFLKKQKLEREKTVNAGISNIKSR
ncbi:Transient receptor potential cation channel subfamily M member 6 [Paragonimus heterotremus]|uniref:Transient receptor potential cation channel subfamily M member 6 n=1 Tax=Paragonimus heterotremus TaxID=100268 RepID=A0A8J4STC3_9TREM|nr:Transient receptor potential cation channel subfamily M member 6 [Paragonimus heterotremus]